MIHNRVSVYLILHVHVINLAHSNGLSTEYPFVQMILIMGLQLVQFCAATDWLRLTLTCVFLWGGRDG